MEEYWDLFWTATVITDLACHFNPHHGTPAQGVTVPAHRTTTAAHSCGAHTIHTDTPTHRHTNTPTHRHTEASQTSQYALYALPHALPSMTSDACPSNVGGLVCKYTFCACTHIPFSNNPTAYTRANTVSIVGVTALSYDEDLHVSLSCF